jgi:hypothetical protein
VLPDEGAEALLTCADRQRVIRAHFTFEIPAQILACLHNYVQR